MMALAMIPLTAMIGSGLDMARAYMAKEKLQTACDAAALAARRHMASGTLSSASRSEGERFFNFNFPPGTMDTPTVNLSIQADATDLSRVLVSASTQVPTTVMAMFGKKSIPIQVSCSADQDYVHNDIMLVLDVTLSMNCAAGSGQTYCTDEQPNSRIQALRGAAAALYEALDGADGVQMRFGFVPYSMTTNVGKDLPSDYLRDPAKYRDKDGKNQTVNHNSSWFSSNKWTGCVEERASISKKDDPNIRLTNSVHRNDVDEKPGNNPNTKFQPYDPEAQQSKTSWGFDDRLAAFCPAPAKKLAVYASKKAFQDQLDAALAEVGGYTFHDTGMLWALRYLSSTGFFASDNPEFLNTSGVNIPVQKHIIFLTDGELIVSEYAYSSFGVEKDDKRVDGGGSQQSRHKDRFLSACDQARQLNATVWVIALDVAGTADIAPCASGSDHFFVSNGSDLGQVFSLIGKGIGRLRMTS